MIERLEVLSSHTPRHKPLYNSHRPLTREDFRRQRKVILEEIQSGWLCMDHGVVFLILVCLINQPLRLTSVWMLRKVRKRGETYVWSLVRRFDQPQKYKPFISRCVVLGNLGIGSLREVDVRSGLPATTSTERLELLDDDEHILSIRIVGGDHRLKNYSSIISLHPEIIDGRPGTLVIESFVVDVPDGNTKDETCYFVEALIKCNLKSLADVSEHLAVQDRTEPIDSI
ncbi:abscisic acid receptor PYL8-like [Populus alba x Populus x berolinensis]|nr:abscisic acid receptor PYL8-like [Populus alba x Populus x berolinensis]